MTKLLVPFSWIYGAAIALRNTGFDRGWWASQELPCPVISVGNLTVGGTGKTPMVITLAEMLQRMNLKVGILSRGYRRRSRGTMLVSDGRGNILGPDQSGDEPAVMAAHLPDVPIVVDKVRIRGGRLLVEQFHPHVILLDDGFQYRWLHRDIDMALLDAKRPFSNGKLLPAGWLREPIKNLRRADVVVFTRTTEKYPTPDTAKIIADLTDAPVLKSVHRAKEWINLDGSRKSVASAPVAERPLLLSGIVRPDDFEAAVRSLGIHPVAHLTFPDHQRYGPQELERIAELYRSLKADAILTTEKDIVKLPTMLNALNVWALPIAMEFTEGEETLDQLIRERISDKLDGKKGAKSA